MKHDRRLLALRGQDRVKFLNDLLTIEIKEDMPLRYGALLSAQGKIQTDLFVFSEGSQLLIDLPTSEFDNFKSKLSLYKLRADVEWEDDERAVGQDEGEGDPRGDVGQRVYGEVPEWPESAYRRARIEAVVPEFGIDFSNSHAYPREWRFDEMGGIDYKKGCFVGQEIAARMRHKSNLLKSVIRVYAQDELQTGIKISSSDKIVGEILSAQSNSALAFVKLKSLDFTTLRAGNTVLNSDNLG